jgi:hypothetical protein
MPCGASARLTAYVAYKSLAFTERDVLLVALAEAGYAHIESAVVGAEASNPISVIDDSGRVVAAAAIVCRGQDLPAGFGDLGFVMFEGAYVPLVPSDSRAERLLKSVRVAYGRAKATQLAEQARRRYQATVQRSTATDGSVTLRVRF